MMSFSKDTRYYIKGLGDVQHFEDEDFVVCGYVRKPDATSLVLGLYDRGEVIYQGHLALGIMMLKVVGFTTTNKCPFGDAPKGNEGAAWFDPLRVCVAKYMYRTESGGMRQPSLVAFRDDKLSGECRISRICPRAERRGVSHESS